LLDGLTDAQRLERGVIEHWSVKDLMAHVAFWEDRCWQILSGAKEGTKPPLFDQSFDLDKINADAYAASKDRSHPDVAAEFYASYPRLYALVESLSEADLSDPTRFAWTNGTPLWRYVEGDGYEHYREHADQIEAWLNRAEE
jgi:hypothetical protein